MKLLYKLVLVNTILVILLALSITLGIKHYAFQLIEENRMMAYQNFLLFQDAMQHYLLYSSLLVIPIAIGLCLFLTRAIVDPLSRMKELTQRIVKGDYIVQLKVRGKDEIGDLARSFNQMSAELERIEKLRRQIVGDVAHELRTPLTTIRGYVEALKDGILPVNQELLTRCYSEVERIVRLVEDIHYLTQFDYQLRDTKIDHPIEVRPVLEETIALYRPKWEEKGLQFEWECDQENPGKIRIQKYMLIQVFVNLFDNTVRYTPEGGTIRIIVLGKDGECYIEVTNTGVEIPVEHLPHIFERFYRVDKSRARTQGGVGIGLAIVRDIVHSVGGVVRATSENQTITIQLRLPSA